LDRFIECPSKVGNGHLEIRLKDCRLPKVKKPLYRTVKRWWNFGILRSGRWVAFEYLLNGNMRDLIDDSLFDSGVGEFLSGPSRESVPDFGR